MAGAKAKRKPPGRPTKYTPERVERIIGALRGGNYRCVAAQYGGISHETFCQWMNTHSEFSEAVIEAETAAEVEAVNLIRSGHPKYILEWLARKNHERWGKKDHVTQEISGPGGGPIELLGHLTDEQVKALLKGDADE